MPKVDLYPLGKSLDVDSETSLLEVLRKDGVYIRSSCGGFASCTDCVVKVTKGLDHLNEIPFEETQLLGNVFHITKERLACQLKISGDIEVDISRHDEQRDQEKIKSKRPQNTRLRKSGEKPRARGGHSSAKRGDTDSDQTEWKQSGFKRPKRKN